jgi:hypothetical protein
MTPFQQAFADARAAGKKEFEFNGKPYHTRLKGEKVAKTDRAAEAPPRRTAKATVSQTVRPTGTTTTKTVTTKPASAGAIPTVMARPKMDAATRMLDRNLRGTGKGATTSVVAKTTTGPKTTTMAALKANRKDFSRAAVEAKKMATMTGPKVARKK